MDIEKLTKQQIVLVTLLVSFVTSIATGIVTVSLMDQAPAGVTQTINRVVERTVEKVVTPPSTGQAAAVVTRETVVVKEDDKISDSVEQNKNSVVRIYTNTPDSADRVFVGLGTILSADGLIVTGDVFADSAGRYIVTVDGNTFYRVKVLDKPEKNHFYFLRIVPDNKNNPPVFKPAIVSDVNPIKLGQTVIGISGSVRNTVFTGIISSLITDENQPGSLNASTTQVVGLMTNINLSDSIPGGPLLNLNGEVVGIRIGTNMSEQFSYLPANVLKTEIVGQ